MLMVWEISRKGRDLAVYVKIRDLCAEVGMCFWLVRGSGGEHNRGAATDTSRPI